MPGQAIAAPLARISSRPRMAPARPGPVMPGQAIARLQRGCPSCQRAMAHAHQGRAMRARNIARFARAR